MSPALLTDQLDETLTRASHALSLAHDIHHRLADHAAPEYLWRYVKPPHFHAVLRLTT